MQNSIYRKLNLDNLSREKHLQDLTSISTFIDKMIQTSLVFANTI